MMDINLSSLSIEELQGLNHQIVDHLKLRQQRKSQEDMNKFEFGDTVSFLSSSGEIITGKIIRFNQKSITLETENKYKWRVSPHLLGKVIVTETRGIPTEVVSATSDTHSSLFRNTNRNSRCPCGSGRKYKKCCA